MLIIAVTPAINEAFFPRHVPDAKLEYNRPVASEAPDSPLGGRGNRVLVSIGAAHLSQKLDSPLPTKDGGMPYRSGYTCVRWTLRGWRSQNFAYC
jgi:hypothetical protein